MTLEMTPHQPSIIAYSRQITGDQPAMRKAYRPAPRAVEDDEVCKIKFSCGACKFVNTDYATGLRIKYHEALKTLEAKGLVDGVRLVPPVASPHPLGYRTLFKLAVRPISTQPRSSRGHQPMDRNHEDFVTERFAIGLFQPGSHAMGAPMDDCPVHAAPLRRLLRGLRQELDASTLTPYSETERVGDVRYVIVRAAHITSELMVTFVVTRPVKLELQRIVAKLKARGHKLQSVHMNLNITLGNEIFGDTTIKLCGNDALRERICNLSFEIGPTSFFQINPWQASQLYHRIEQIAGHAAPGEVAWDLYSGLGQIAMVLGRLGYRTLGIEENAAAVTAATLNARRNDLAEVTTFLAGRVEESEKEFPSWSHKPALIAVNPSRRGLHEGARSHLVHTLRLNPTARFIYVSCEVETLARDLEALKASGFKVRQIEAFDMFAQTDKLEWLAVLTQ